MPALALPQADTLPCGVMAIDGHGRLLAVNQRLGQLLGQAPAALVGGSIDQVLAPAGRVLFQSYLLPLLRLHGHVQEFSLTLRAADGGPVEVLLYASTAEHAAGQGCDIVVVPIRQRRQLEQEMLRVKRAADESPDMIFQLLCGPQDERHFPYVSEAVRRLYGSTPQQALASADAVFDRVLAADRPAIDQALADGARHNRPWRGSYRVHTAAGGVAWHEASATPRTLAGGMTLWHGHVADVTQRRQVEQVLAEKAAAERASQAKSAFLARVSHELRTPLNGLLGFAQLLATQQADNLRDDQHARLAIVRQAGAGLLQLVNDVLDITSIEMGQLRLQPVPVDLAALLGQALPLVAAAASAAGVTLQPVAQAAEPLWAMADPLRLQQVLANLLSNAVKYNRPGGRVQVRLATGVPGTVAIEVCDTGIGMDPAQLAALFQPFNRLGAERSRVEGIGLGLAISQHLVQLMGGQITVTSTPGQGSCLQVALPQALAEPGLALAEPGLAAAAPVAVPTTTAPPVAPAAAEADSPPHRPPPPTRGRVLYVEDNPVNVALMEAIIGMRPGVDLRVAEDGAGGLAAALAQPPDLLLIDMHLPDTDGAQLLQALRGHAPLAGVPAVAVSANAAADDLQRAQLAGFVDYWTKPVDIERLLSALDKLLAPPCLPPAGGLH
ncbi:MAG: hypothetical protein CFE45_01310 [Burkholderiales bacterium PBB5]|nr:MAG: hypothetical protein CFE45_01310 [Burkholderiales bacterium PBB5]